MAEVLSEADEREIQGRRVEQRGKYHPEDEFGRERPLWDARNERRDRPDRHENQRDLQVQTLREAGHRDSGDDDEKQCRSVHS